VKEGKAMKQSESLGEVAYLAFWARMGLNTIKPFKSIDVHRREAWEAAADAVSTQVVEAIDAD
jgi:hypothetical protein